MLIALTSMCIVFYHLELLVYLFFHYSGIDAMGRGLKGINHDRRKFYTSLNRCKGPPSLGESLNTATVISVASDNYGSEFNNDIVTETEESDDGSAKLSSPSGM